jgi:thiol:disulfide interchange protein
MLWAVAAAALFAALPGNARSQSSVSAPHLTVALVANQPGVSAQPAGGLHLGLLFKLDPGWHVYWSNAGDSGEPPAVKWQMPAGFTVGPLAFPAPKRLPLGPLMDFGYEHEVLFPASVTVARARAGAPSEPLTFGADVNWLVCREACIPGKAHLALTLPQQPAAATPSASAPLFDRTFARMPKPLPAGAKAVFASAPGGLRLALLTGKQIDGAQFFPSQPGQIDNPAPQPVTPLRDGAVIGLHKDANLKTAPEQLSGVVVLADGTAYTVDALPGAVSLANAVPVQGAMAVKSSAGLLRVALLAFAGGILLNLMPCVFPVLFIKALALVQSSSVERRHMRVQGLVYTLGILVSFWVVVAVLLGLRAGGQHLGWGFQFQSPVFVACMALLLFFLGLSLAGMFDIGLSVTSAGSSLATKSGYAGSFFTGVLAMVVATPCTGPFMGAAIGFALTRSAATTFLIFTALGLGLALPYLLLAFQPAWTRILPRPGAWMEVLKQATSVPIFATVIWMVWLFAQSAGVNALLGLLSAFLLLAVAAWILGRWPARRGASVAAVAVIALAVAAPVYSLRTLGTAGAPASASSSAVDAKDGPRQWEAFTPTIVAQYQKQGRPVFVDFTANWCLSCQVNERVVLNRADVEARLHGSDVALVRADWTRHDDQIAHALEALGRNGVPTYALYPGVEGAEPKLLPEVLTPGIVLDALTGLDTPEPGKTPRVAAVHPSQ